MKIFELELGLTATGQQEAAAGLKAIDDAGGRAAGTLNIVEEANRRIAAAAEAATQALKAEGIELDQHAFAKGLQQGIAQGFRDVEAAATSSAPSVGTFNQAVAATTTHAAGGTRGLYLLDRGLGSIIGSTVGATSGFERLGEGLLLVSSGGHTATLVMAAIAVPLIALVGIYELLTVRQRAVAAEFDAAYDKFAKQKAGADALATAYMGYAQALDEAAKARERLSELEGPVAAAPIPQWLKDFIGGQSKFPILGPGFSGIAGIVAGQYEQAKGSEAQDAATKALNASQREQIAVYQQEAGTLRDLITAGNDVAANRERLRTVEGQLTAAVNDHIATVIRQNQAQYPQMTTIPELIAVRRTEIATLIDTIKSETDHGRITDETRDKLARATAALHELEAAYKLTDAATKTIATDTKDLAAAMREAAQPGIALAHTLVDLMRLGIATAADRRMAITLERAYAQAAKDTNLSIEARAALGGAARAIQQELNSESKQASEAEKQHYQQLVQNARLAMENLHTFGATNANMAAAKTAVLALAAATTDENAANLRKKGLLEVLIALVKELTSASQELAKIEDRTSQIPFRPATFGLGTVTRTAGGMPVQFGQGLSVGAGTVGAPTRPLTGGLGEGFGGGAGGFGLGPIPFLPPTSSFDRALNEFDNNMDRVRQRAKTQGKIISAEMADVAIDLSKAFEQAMESAFVSLAQVFGDLFANLFKGANKADIGKEALQALGTIFVRLGEAMIAASPIFKALAAAMHNPFTAGPALLAYGAALVALGTLLGGIATGSGGAGPGAAGGNTANTPIRVIIVDSASGQATRIAQPAFVHYGPNTFIGVTDPRGQAQVARMVQLGQRRNLPSGI